MNSWVSQNRWSRFAIVLALCVSAAACSDSTPTTTSTTTGPVGPSTVPLDTPEDLVAALGAAWTSGDETRLTELVPDSAAALLDWGQPESVTAVLLSDCTLGSAGTGRCELLTAIDGTGLLFNMAFSQGSDGALRIDQVTFAGDAG